MDARSKMKPAFAATQGGLFAKVAKADVGGGFAALSERGVAMLAWADPFFPSHSIPEHVEKALMDAVLHGSPEHYTQPIGNDDLKKVIAAKLKEFNGLDVDPSRNILVTPGSDSGLFYAMLPFVGPGVDVMVLDPSYPNNFQNVQLMGGNIIRVPLKRENDFQPSIEDFESRLTENTKVIVLTNPNNPTTTVLHRDFLEQLAEFAVKNDLICVVDQAFEDSVYDDVEFVTLASLPGMFERTVTVFSISKGMGLSGLRVGYIVAPDTVMDVLYGCAVAVIGAASTPAQIAAIAAFENHEFKEEYTRIFDQRRRKAYEIFKDVPKVHMNLPQSGFFSWIDVSELGTGAEIAEYLLKNDIAAVNGGSAYGEQGVGYIRIIHGALGTEEEIEKALHRIADALRDYPAKKEKE